LTVVAHRPSVDLAFRHLADCLVDASTADVEAHRLELVAASERRRRGLEVPAALRTAERLAAVTALAAPEVLRTVRESYDGRIMLLKGPEIAAHYPDATLRGYSDIDVLVEDAQEAHGALLAAGFREVGNPKMFENIHHLRPVALPALGVPVEIHFRPKWVDGHQPPAVEQLFATSVPSATGIEGIEAPGHAYHVLLLAAHSWAHEPLRRIRDLVDIACLEPACRPGEVDGLAGELGVARLWSSTRAAVATMTSGSQLPLPIRLWARNVALCRERTVLESHLTQWLSGFASEPPLTAIRGLPEALHRTFSVDAERPGQKLRRSYRALRNARVRRSEHEAAVEDLMPPPFTER